MSEQKYIKHYYTEENNEETISVFVNHENKAGKYLIIGNWKIDDGSAEKIFDQILSTFEFTS